MKRTMNVEKETNNFNDTTSEEVQENTSLHDYLKEHPSVWISAISGIVVVLGFLFRNMIYANECKYLQYWHLDKELVHIQNENGIYELAVASFLFLGILFVGFLIMDSAERFFRNQRVIYMVNKTYKNIKKEYKNLKNQIEESKKESETAENKNLLQKEILTLESIVMMYDKILPKYESNMKEVQKKICRKNGLCTLVTLLLAFVCLIAILIVTAAMSSTGIGFMGIVIVAVITMLLLGVCIYAVYWIDYTRRVRKQISKMDIGEQCNASEEEFERLLKKEKEADSTARDGEHKQVITKETLIKATVYAVILFVVIAGFISAGKKNEIKENRTFQIADYEDKSYAVLYRDDAYFYLEEVEIKGEAICIYVNRQLRIATEELYSVSREFDSVKQVTE